MHFGMSIVYVSDFFTYVQVIYVILSIWESNLNNATITFVELESFKIVEQTKLVNQNFKKNVFLDFRLDFYYIN